MELHPLRLPDMPSELGPVRFHYRSPKTVAEVLAEASARMDEQDRAEDPVAWLRAHRPARTLWARLLGR